MSDVEIRKKLRVSFKNLDENGDGKLSFAEFFKLLKQGDPDFLQREAEQLFNEADADGSGFVDFEEFIDYIFGSKDLQDLAISVPVKGKGSARDEETCRQQVLAVPLPERSAASRAVNAKGGDWSKLSWAERWAEVEALSGGGTAAPPAKKADKPAAKAPPPPVAAPAPKASPRPAAPAAPRKNVPLAEKTQAELVDYSIKSDDISAAGEDYEAKSQLSSFKEFLKTAPGPDGIMEVKRYLAKGTNGYVFEASLVRQGGQKTALKLIRMTQARTGMTEWYVSKLLRANDVPNCVLAEEDCIVMPKEGSPPAVFDILSKAGPVPFYLGLAQEFMNGGSLEGDANEGKLSPKVLFTALADVAIALAGMHAIGVQHRDVKPENAMFAKKDGEVIACKVCDFGSAQVGENPAGEADDIRRFGVTVMSCVTMEEWTKNKLIREPHKDVVNRLKDFVKDKRNPAYQKVPQVVEKILSGTVNMEQVADMMGDLQNIA